MKNKFIICVSDSSIAKDKAFIEILSKNNLDWWHYIDNVWLVVDSSEKLKVTDLRNYTKQAFDNEFNVVFSLKSVDNNAWAGYGPNNGNMFKWIKKKWL